MFSIKYLIILFFLTTNSLNGQIFMRGVEPLNPYNLWKYQDTWSFSMPTYFQVTDSLVNFGDNTFYVVETFNENFINKEILFLGLSSNDFYIRYDTNASDSIYRYYKKDSKIGDSWIQEFFIFTLYYTVIDTFTINAWGERYFSKLLKITDSSLVEVYQLWADSIGLMEENSIGQYDMVLTGCVINGKVYGDTSIVTSIEERIELPKSYQLSQNYPNPFNPATNISFYLPENSEVLLEVYNVLGEKIKTLINEYRSAGRYTETFNGAGLPSGIYIYRIIAGEYIDMKKMVITK